MKRFLIGLGCLVAVGSLVYAASQFITANLVNETALAYSNTYSLNAYSYHLDTLTAQANYSSATVTAATFTDGTKSTATITVVSTMGVVGAYSTDTITVNANTPLSAAAGSARWVVQSNATETLTGVTLRLNGRSFIQNTDWVRGNSSSWTAVNIAAAANNLSGFTATAAGSSVTVTCTSVGTACNSIAITTNKPTAVSTSAATLSGGSNNASITFNGYPYYAGTDWTVGAVSSDTAINIKTLANTWTGVTASTTSSTVVTIQCSTKGLACNSYTLASSTAAIAAGAATFSGGRTPASFVINGVRLTEGTDFTGVATTTGTAKAIKDALDANTSISAITTNTWTAGSSVVYSTSNATGSNVNYSIWTSTAALRIVSPAYFGGTANAVSTSADSISASNSFTTALPVVLEKTAGTVPTGLTVHTTYYAIPVNSNSFKLSLTSTGAVAGLVIDITGVTGSGTFSLTPLTFSGVASFKWQGSNDNSNWFDLSVSSVSIMTTTGSTVTSWDFSSYNYAYVRVKYVAPTQGGAQLNVIWGGKTKGNIYRP